MGGIDIKTGDQVRVVTKATTQLGMGLNPDTGETGYAIGLGLTSTDGSEEFFAVPAQLAFDIAEAIAQRLTELGKKVRSEQN